MKSSIKKIFETTLILNEEETKWLQKQLQNAVTNNETNKDKEVRHNFFNALKH